MSGLIDKFELQTDTFEQLVKAIEIAMVWDRKVTHYRRDKDVHGEYLAFDWHENGKGLPLISPMEDARPIAEQVWAWLKNIDYGRGADGDGTDVKGFYFTTKESNSCWSYEVFRVYPHWVHYGK